jgi:hypothetical protein
MKLSRKLLPVWKHVPEWLMLAYGSSTAVICVFFSFLELARGRFLQACYLLWATGAIALVTSAVMMAQAFLMKKLNDLGKED